MHRIKRQVRLHWYLNLANMKGSFCDSCHVFFSANLFLEVYSMSEVKRPFKVEEQLLCWISQIEIEEQKWGASANFEGENCGGKRRSHHLGMRECFFDQWIFHSVWQDLFPGFHVVAPSRNIFTAACLNQRRSLLHRSVFIGVYITEDTWQRSLVGSWSLPNIFGW